MTSLEKTKKQIEQGVSKTTRWIGSTKSIIIHSIFFATCFALPFFGIAFDRVLLVLTTVVSLEAIYLSIFIQMTVNKNTENIEEIQENVEEIQEDIEEIEEEHEEDYKKDRELEMKEHQTLSAIQATLAELSREIDQLKKK